MPLTEVVLSANSHEYARRLHGPGLAAALYLSIHLAGEETASQRGQKAQEETAGAQSDGKWQITALMRAIHHFSQTLSLPLFSSTTHLHI